MITTRSQSHHSPICLSTHNTCLNFKNIFLYHVGRILFTLTKLERKKLIFTPKITIIKFKLCGEKQTNKSRKIKKTYNDKLIFKHVKNINESCKYMALLQLAHCVPHLESKNSPKKFNFWTNLALNHFHFPSFGQTCFDHEIVLAQQYW